MNADLAFTLLIGGLFLAAPLIYLAGRVSWTLSNGRLQPVGWMALFVCLLAWFPYAILVADVRAGGMPALRIGTLALEMDGLGLFMAGTILLVITLVCIYSLGYLRGEGNREKYNAMLCAICAAMIGLCCARDLFNLWVWFEAMTITSYLLVIFYNDRPGALEAGVKYLIQSSAGSLFILIGIALAFGVGGTLDLVELRQALKGAGMLGSAAGALLMVGFGVKAALVPMHTWLPDAHSQAPSGVSALLSGLVIECGLIAMLRALGGLAAVSAAWGPLLLAFGLLNMIVGNLMALRQVEVKRLLAFSSVAQVGYMLIGFGLASAYGIRDGAAGGLFHLFNHAVMKGLAFMAAGTLLYSLHIANHSHASLKLDDLNGASRRYPFTAFALSVAVLALGGLPPLSGFMSKWQILVAGVTVRSTPALWIVILTALNSVLSLAYYAPLVNRLYRREPSAAVLAGKPASFLMAAPMAVFVILSVVPGLWPALLSWFTEGAALSLLRGFGF